MKLVTVEVYNENGIDLLQELEKLNVLRIVTETQHRLSDKFMGVFSSEDAASFDEHTRISRAGNIAEEASINFLNGSHVNKNLPELIPFRKGDKWGFCDRNKKIVIECIYNEVGAFSKGIAWVKITENINPNLDLNLEVNTISSERYGYINKLGDLIFPCILQEAYDLREDLALVKLDEKFGFINEDGIIVIPIIYEQASQFKECYARIKMAGKWGFIDNRGIEKIPCSYHWADDFSEGLAIVGYADQEYIDYYNKGWEDPTTGIRYQFPGSMDMNYGFINIQNEVVIECKYPDASEFRNGLACVKFIGNDKFIDAFDKCRWKYINDCGEDVTKADYAIAKSFSEDIASVKKYFSGAWGCINREGVEVIPFVFDGLTSFSEGLCGANKNEKWGYINKVGETVIDFLYDVVGPFSNGFAVIGINDKMGVISKNGEVKIPLQSEFSFEYFKDNLFTTSTPIGIFEENGTYQRYDNDIFLGYQNILGTQYWED